MERNSVRIGMLQILVEFSRPTANLLRAELAVREAASQGAEICILPEALDLGWANPEAVTLATPIPGPVSNRLASIAKDHKVWLVAGMTERVNAASASDSTPADRIYNTALLISPEGKILAKHRKINILTGVEDVYSIGDRLSVTETPLGRIGIDICADNTLTSIEIGHVLARMGAQMILSPCAWAVLPDRDPVKEPYGNEWHVPYGQLSSLYHIPIIGVSNVGQVTAGSWKGWKAIGNSIAYGRDGKVLDILPYGENASTVRVLDVEIGDGTESGTALSGRVYHEMHA